jgi:hypothetical protein
MRVLPHFMLINNKYKLLNECNLSPCRLEERRLSCSRTEFRPIHSEIIRQGTAGSSPSYFLGLLGRVPTSSLILSRVNRDQIIPFCLWEAGVIFIVFISVLRTRVLCLHIIPFCLWNARVMSTLFFSVCEMHESCPHISSLSFGRMGNVQTTHL